MRVLGAPSHLLLTYLTSVVLSHILCSAAWFRASLRLTVTQGVAQVAADTLQQAIYCPWANGMSFSLGGGVSLWLGLVWVNVDSSAAEMTSFLLLVSKLGHQVNSFKSQVEDGHFGVLFAQSSMQRRTFSTPATAWRSISNSWISSRRFSQAWPGPWPPTFESGRKLDWAGTYDGPVQGHVVFEDVSFAYPTRPEQTPS